MKIFKDGNFTYAFSWVLIVFGIGLGYAGVYLFDDYFSQAIFVSIGLFFASMGGYAGKARILGLRPFDTAPWKRARKTYDESKMDE